MRLPDLRRLIPSRRRQPSLTRDEAVSARPLRNPAIAWEVTDAGRVLLTVPLELKPWMRLVRPVIGVPTEKQVELDEIGSDVWSWCDGETTVGDLVQKMAEKHKLNPREAEVSLTTFLQTLAQRRFVGLAVELDDERVAELGEVLTQARRTEE